MHTIKTSRFCLPPTEQMEFTVNFIQTTTLNQSEPHIHKECEIYVNLAGDVSFEVEGRIYPVSRGTAIITRPYEYHHCILHSSQPHCHFWITFSAAQEDYLTSFFRREKGRENRIVLADAALESFCQVAHGLIADNCDSLQRRIGVLQLFQILQQGNRTEAVGSLENLPADVVAVLLYMDKHLTEDVDIHTLAQISGVSIHTMERHFRQSLGTLPMETLRKKRLFASMQYLRNGDTVAGAALKSGFSDYSHYIQVFKRQFGITPLAYKKNMQNT